MMTIKYRRTLQVEEFEPISIEVSRNYDDTDENGSPVDPSKAFIPGVRELEKLVDNEIELHVKQLRDATAKEEFDSLVDVGE